jgi:hypothetical protein
MQLNGIGRIDAQLELVADAIADAAHHFQIFFRAAAGFRLERSETLLDIALGDGFRFVIRADAHAGREFDAFANRAAEQLVKRLVDRLADDVPHCHLDPARQIAA